MKCLRKFKWIKIPRNEIPCKAKGLMIYFLRLASRAAFRKGKATYCGHTNAVEPGSWAGGVVGIKSILQAKSRRMALEILDELQMMGYITYTLEPKTKILTYRITDWVCACSGKEEPDGNVYTTPECGFVCMPRNITERLADKGHVFGEADAWLDLWCHTLYRDYGNAFSFLSPAIQYGQYGSVLTMETLGQRWKWEKTKVWRFFQKFASYFSLHRLPGSYGCVIFNICYPTVDECEDPSDEDIMRILELIRIKARNTHTAGTDNERLNRFVAWKSRKVIKELEEAYTQEEIQNESEKSSDFRDRQNSRVAEIPHAIRAYFSHGRNCKNSRNCIYDCQGKMIREPKSLDFFTLGEEVLLRSLPFSTSIPAKEEHMKLHKNQLDLILHLIRLNIMAYTDCLTFLDTENTGDRIAMSYAFRPLTKNGYLSKSKDGIVTVLQKGRELFPEEGPLISVATHGQGRKRVLQVSRVCMWMEKCGVPICGQLPDTEEPCFIPSACWRRIAKGILSTTRFAGMLVAYDKRYAVYDIGDGTMDWQLRAESSLFYRKYGSYETKADGMILICENGRRNEIAKQIIRQTMWARKALLKDRYAETDKPVRYSRSPIKLRTQYEHVYLTTPALLKTSLERIYGEKYHIEHAVKGSQRSREPAEGDVEVYPNRYYLNPAFDLLKLVHFFSAVKDDMKIADNPYVSFVTRILVIHREDLEVTEMYPDVKGWKEVKILVYKSPQNA